MNIQEFLGDREAVSPVIGMILMVAITVILAAVIGTFVLGLGDQVQKSAPQTSFTFDFTDNSGTPDELAVTHDGGDTVVAGEIVSVGDDNLQIDSNGDDTFGGDAVRLDAISDSFTATTDITAGTTVHLQANAAGGAADDDMEAESVRVVWESDDGDNTATLGKWNGPDA